MIQLSSLLPAMPHGPVRPALLASAGGSSFALALGALAMPRAAPVAAGEADALLPARQMPAEGGKDLPEPTPDQDDSEAQDAPEDGADIAFAWFAVAPVAQPVPAAPALTSAAVPVAHADACPVTLPVAADRAAGVATDAPVAEGAVEQPMANLPAPHVAAPRQGTETRPVPAGDVPQIAVADAPAPAPRGQAAAIAGDPASTVPAAMPARPAITIAPGAPPAARDEARAREPVRASAERPSEAARPAPAQRSPEQMRATLSPAPAPVPSVAPLGPTVELAIAASLAAAPPPPRRAPAMEPAAFPVLAPAADAVQPHAISAAPDVQQAVLDTRRQEWMGKMVEHIEALRDAAPVRETRLSLAPEGLGKVDVSIRHEGDRVHVHFATETPAARQLIADAQPRLNELAEARGLKLGQTSFDSGSAGQGANRESRGNPAPQQSPKPRPAYSETHVGTADDERVA